jgi:hypothetical protein
MKRNINFMIMAAVVAVTALTSCSNPAGTTTTADSNTISITIKNDCPTAIDVKLETENDKVLLQKTVPADGTCTCTADKGIRVLATYVSDELIDTNLNPSGFNSNMNISIAWDADKNKYKVTSN